MDHAPRSRITAPNFKPLSLRWPLLVPFALYVCSLIASIEYASRVFPSAQDRGNIPQQNPGQTAFVSVPLINPRAPTPTVARPQPTPTPPSALHMRTPKAPRAPRATRQPWARVPRGSAHRIRNATEPNSGPDGGTPGQFANTTQNGPNDASPFSPADLAGAQQSAIDQFNRTGRPVSFGGRGAFPPGYSLNQSATRPAAYYRPRHQDPSRYGQLSGAEQIIQPILNIGWNDGIPYYGESWINYVNPYWDGVPKGLDLSFACWATCDGPAIVYRSLDCWHDWVLSAAQEDEARTLNPSLSWKVTESLDPGSYRCQPPEPDSPSDTSAGGVKAAVPSQVVVLTDSAGVPTGTMTMFESSLAPRVTGVTLRDSQGKATATVTVGLDPRGAGLVTLTDSNGVPTATASWAPALTTMTLRDSAGSATATLTAELSPGAAYVTLTDSNGVPTATRAVYTPRTASVGRTPPSPIPTQAIILPGESRLHPLSSSEYSIGYFLPVLLCSPISILAQVVNSNLKVLLPFHAMTRPEGATASHSVLLSTEGIEGIISSFKLLFQLRDPVSLLGDLLILLSALVTSFSSEAVGINLYGNCLADNFSGCYMGVAVFQGASRALEVLLGVLLLDIALLGYLVWGWRTGISSSSQSIAATASLTQHLEMRELLRGIEVDNETQGHVGNRDLTKHMEGRRFFLQGFRNSLKGQADYGVTTHKEDPLTEDSHISSVEPRRRGRWLEFPGWLTRQPTCDWASLVAITLICGMLALILYYETTEFDSPFEDFMNDQNFGARLLFTGCGVAINIFWGEYFAGVSRIESYRLLSRRPRPARTSVLVSPPTTVFTGLSGAIARREWFISIVGFATVSSEFLPIMLSLIPFSPSQTWNTHLLCAWTTVGGLALMILVLVYGAVFVRYPHMPVSPDSLAGRMYYVCDSAMLSDFRCLSLASGKEWGRRIHGRKKYCFGSMVGVSGRERLGVDYEGYDEDDEDFDHEKEDWKENDYRPV